MTAARERLAELVERVAPGVAAIALGAGVGRRAELAKELRAAGAAFEGLPRGVPWQIRGECDAIARDGTGRTAWEYVRRLKPRLRMLLLRVCELAGGARSPKWVRVVQCVWATWRLGRPVKTRSRSFRARFWAGGLCVDGYACRVWNLLVRRPDGREWSHNTLWGTHNGRAHEPGPMALLASAGLWTRQQPPKAKARWVGPSGYPLGQFWMGRRNAGRKPPTVAELIEVRELERAHAPG